MSPMLWLDLWLGHVLAAVSAHDCPAIFMTHGAITQMEIIVIFKKTMVHIHKLMHTMPFLWLSCTKLQHYGAVFCDALVYFLYVQKNQLTYWTIALLTCQQDSLADIFWWVSQTFANMLLAFGHVLVPCHFRCLGNITWCQHFQLRCFSLRAINNILVQVHHE